MTRGKWCRGLNLRSRYLGLAILFPVVLHEGGTGVKVARWAEPCPSKEICVKRETVYRYHRCRTPKGSVIGLDGA